MFVLAHLAIKNRSPPALEVLVIYTVICQLADPVTRKADLPVNNHGCETSCRSPEMTAVGVSWRVAVRASVAICRGGGRV